MSRHDSEFSINLVALRMWDGGPKLVEKNIVFAMGPFRVDKALWLQRCLVHLCESNGHH